MNTVAQTVSKGPFVNDSDEAPPPPPTQRSKRKRGPAPPASDVRPVALVDEHERRISARVERERRELAEQAAAYLVIANEVESPSLQHQRMETLLATAIGAYPGEPLLVLLEEIRTRCGTLMHTARGGRDGADQDDLLEVLEQELAMLRTRAEVAGELARRFGGLRDFCGVLRQNLIAEGTV